MANEDPERKDNDASSKARQTFNVFRWTDIGKNTPIPFQGFTYTTEPTQLYSEFNGQRVVMMMDTDFNQKCKFKKNNQTGVTVYLCANNKCNVPYQPVTNYMSLVFELYGTAFHEAQIVLIYGQHSQQQSFSMRGSSKGEYEYYWKDNWTLKIDTMSENRELQVLCFWKRPKKMLQQLQSIANIQNPFIYECLELYTPSLLSILCCLSVQGIN